MKLCKQSYVTEAVAELELTVQMNRVPFQKGLH